MREHSYITELCSFVAEVIRICPRSSENINECICESIELLRTNLANGDFGDNFTIPKIEPLFIDEIKINRGDDFNEMVFKNLFVSGPSQFVLKNMRSELKTQHRRLKITLDCSFSERTWKINHSHLIWSCHF